jgi:hypothetical protein
MTQNNSTYPPISRNLSGAPYIYCTGFHQRIARQRLRKHAPTRNNTTTGLFNPLLGNSPVNTFQHARHATMEEVVFSMR